MIDKTKLISEITQNTNIQLTELLDEIASVNDEIALETKSSAGDKFETSREMMTQVRNRLEERTAYLKRNLNQLKNIPEKGQDSISNGSLATTNYGIFLFCIALGKYTFENNQIYILTLNSPLGKSFHGKKISDKVKFMDKTYTITNIQ